MEQKAEFKNEPFGGYEKESVLKYIDDMSRTAAESEAKLQEQIEQITRSRRELEEQIAEFEKRMQDASETIDAEKGKNKKLSEMIGLLQEEIDRQRRQGESRTREYQAAQEKNRQLQEQVRQVEEKSKLYDEAAASIGSAILQAQQTAQSIVDEAGGQAEGDCGSGQHAGAGNHRRRAALHRQGAAKDGRYAAGVFDTAGPHGRVDQPAQQPLCAAG